MEEKDSQEQAAKNAETDKPLYGWGPVFRGAWVELSSHSWLQNIVIGLALLLIWPLIGVALMNSRKGILIGFGIGVTILVWVGVLVLVRQVPPSVNPPSTPSPSPSPIPTSQEKPHMSEKKEPTESEPRSVSQNMVNSPGGTQQYVGGDIINIHHQPQHLRLSREGVSLLTKLLSDIPEKGRIFVYYFKAEDQAFAFDFKDPCIAAGFGFGYGLLMGQIVPPQGVILAVANLNNIPPFAEPLRSALTTIELPVSPLRKHPHAKAEGVTLLIGNLS